MFPGEQLVALLGAVLVGGLAHAAPLIPGPGDPGEDAALTQLARQYDRQFHTFNADRFGLSLDSHISDADDRALVDAFLAQSAEDDFAIFSAAQGRPRTSDEIVSARGEHGDLGMFGGMPAAGDAFRYMVLRDGGATADEVDQARSDLLEAIASFHVYATITGFSGGIARGIRLGDDHGGAIVPLPATCPDPWTREAEWRADQSGLWPGWRWQDESSKDQLLGYVYAIGAFWDAVAEDPSFDDQVRTTLQADALALGTALMEPVEVRPGTSVDLVMRDTNGCLTRFHDLNPREVPQANGPPLVLAEDSNSLNAFNALAALGIIRTLYHISGDDSLRAFYYDTLVTARDYPGLLTTGLARLKNMFANLCLLNECVVTNFSNVNMAFVAIYGVLRYETDATVLATVRAAMESDLWDGGRPHMGLEIQQAFFNLIYAGLRAGGTDDAAKLGAIDQLGQFTDPPYWNDLVENCDAGELAAGTCLAIDGVTSITLDDVAARGDRPASEVPLPKALRPPNNYEWRSDPRSVNGGGGARLNPGGDFRGSYWLGRMLQQSVDNADNISPVARNRDGSGGPAPIGVDAGTALDAGAAQDVASAPDAVVAQDGAVVTDVGGRDGAGIDVGQGTDAGAVGADAAVDAGGGADQGTATTDPATEDGCDCRAARASTAWPALTLGLWITARALRRRARGS
jgi:hypothetical protein